MHFTIVFDSQEGHDLAAGLVFKPSPVWVAGGQDLVSLHPDSPHYRRGDLRRLLDHPAMQRPCPTDSDGAVVVIHDSGYGEQRDLDALLADLADEGYDATTVSCKAPRP